MFIKERAIRVPGSVKTLACSRPGDMVEVVHFLAPGVRETLIAIGVGEGAMLTCRDRAGEGIVVEIEGGHSAVVAWAYAHLVRVEACAVQPGKAEPRASRRSRASSGWSRA